MVFKCWCQLYHCSPMSCTGLKICVLTVLPMKWVSNDRNVSDGRYLQANNNTQKKDSSTRFLKSGPMLHALSRRRAVALPGNQQRKVPGKTKQNKKKNSEIHQYLPKKIHNWGLKNFVRAGTSWIINIFSFYKGQKSARREKCGASKVVLRLVE